MEYISDVITVIHSNTTEGLVDMLKKIPLQYLSWSSEDDLIAIVVKECLRYGAMKSLEIVLKFFDENSGDSIPTINKLFNSPLLNVKDMRKIVNKIYPTLNYLFVMIPYIDIGDVDPSTFEKVELVFLDTGDLEQYRELYLLLEAHDEERKLPANIEINEFNLRQYSTINNRSLYNYLQEKIVEASPVISKPEYVRDFGLDIDKYMFDPSLEDIIRFMTVQTEKQGLVFDPVEFDRLFRENTDEQSRTKFICDIIQSPDMLRTDDNITRLYGPSNLLVTVTRTVVTREETDEGEVEEHFEEVETVVEEFDNDEETNTYGGCRMFTCMHFETDENDETPDDWFTGVCDQCMINIPNKIYAVRRPLYGGGWVGCFHSWDCVQDYLVRGADPDDVEMVKRNEREGQIVEEMRALITVIGIQDREDKLEL